MSEVVTVEASSFTEVARLYPMAIHLRRGRKAGTFTFEWREEDPPPPAPPSPTDKAKLDIAARMREAVIRTRFRITDYIAIESS